MDVVCLTVDMLPQLFEFEKLLNDEEPGYYAWTQEEAYRRSVRASFADPRFHSSINLIAVEDGRIIGRIDAVLLPSRFDGSVRAYLDWICVTKSCRHRGVAQRLMQSLRMRLASLGVETLVGLIAANEEAQRFYRHLDRAFIRDEGIWIDCFKEA